MNVLSLFSNIGVGEAYLESIGFPVVIANEIDPKRAGLYQKIYPESQMICGDITKSAVTKHLIKEGKIAKVDIVMATPPCQGMSTAGKQHKDDPRNLLFLYAIQIIESLNPKYFIFENVPGFLSTTVKYEGADVLIMDVIRQRLADRYSIEVSVINAKDYEVPQMRERMILLATRKGVSKKWVMPNPSDHIVTMEEAIGWIPIIDPFVKDLPKEEFQRLFPQYEARRAAALKISKWNFPTAHVYRNVLAMQHTPTGCTAFDNEVFKPTKRNGEIVRGFHNTYKRQNWDTPAYTIAMDNIEISSQNNVHPGRYVGKDEHGYDLYSDPRALTLYELMKLMSIPDNWPLPDDTNPVYLRKVLGEGVPSLLVKKIFEQLS